MLKFDIKDVYSWSNAKEAKQYINKEGYFSDDLDELNREINENKLYPLKEVNSNSAICFVTLSPVGRWSCGLFLPASKVKEVEEKKYRPFKTCEEFCDALEIDGVGDCIHFRFKDEPTLNYFVIFNGYVKDEEDQLYSVCLGSYTFTIQHLFEHFEYSVEKGKWQPFGVYE